jgi:hypothetical protein
MTLLILRPGILVFTKKRMIKVYQGEYYFSMKEMNCPISSLQIS